MLLTASDPESDALAVARSDITGSNERLTFGLVAENVPAVPTTEPATGIAGSAIGAEPPEWTYNDLNATITTVISLASRCLEARWPVGVRIAHQYIALGCAAY